MDSKIHAHSAFAFAAWLLLQLLTAPLALYVPPPIEEDNDEGDAFRLMVDVVGEPLRDPYDTITTALHNFRLCISFILFDDDLGYWVKLHSTTWFSRFLLSEYDDSRWVQTFRMTKPAVFALADLLRPAVQKEDTKYSEMFAIGKSTVSAILRDVVYAINDTMRQELTWPTGERLNETQHKVYNLCGLPAVMGAIDGTHIPISKPKHVPEDYYYFKSGGYSLNCQAVVDSEKRFPDLYLGMPGSTNDSCMLRRSSLYDLAMHNTLVDGQHDVQGFSPYLIGDLGYPLLPWLMVPHRSLGPLSIVETLFNRKLRKGRCVVENAFGILKQMFRELMKKSNLNITFLPDVIVANAILHNVLMGQSHEEVENLLEVLRTEGLDGENTDEEPRDEDGTNLVPPERPQGMHETEATAMAVDKRNHLAVFLTTQRQNRP